MSSVLHDSTGLGGSSLLYCCNIPETKVTYSAQSPTEWASGPPLEWTLDSGDMPSWHQLLWNVWESQVLILPDRIKKLMEGDESYPVDFESSETGYYPAEVGESVSNSREALAELGLADALSRHPEINLTAEAYEYLLTNELTHDLLAVVSTISDCISYQELQFSVSEYDDMSGIQLLKITIDAGLKGAEAVRKEEEVLDRLFDAIGPDRLNAFVIEVD